MISNRIEGLSPAYQPPADPAPLAAGIAQSSSRQSDGSTGGVSYAPASSSSAIVNYHPDTARNYNSMLLNQQNSSTQGDGLNTALSKIAELVREILQRLLALLQQGNASQLSANNQSGSAYRPATGDQPLSMSATRFSPLANNSRISDGQTRHDRSTLADAGQTQALQGNNSQLQPVMKPAAVTTTTNDNTLKSLPPCEHGDRTINHAEQSQQGQTSDYQTRLTTGTHLPSAVMAVTDQPQVNDNHVATPKTTGLTTQPVDKTPDHGNAGRDKLREFNQPVSALGAKHADSSNQALNEISGFAQAAKTTGGAGGQVVSVSSVDQLQKALSGDAATTIKVSKDISADAKVVLKFGANKTLESANGAAGLHNIYLASDKSASNDVFRNLSFTHDQRYNANGDIPLFISNGQGYWIDHNTFSGNKSEQAKGMDKLLYVGGTADNVTLSNSVFKDNEYGVILGQPDDTDASAQKYAGYPRMTIANNVFDNLDVRAPGLMREGKFDVFNNLINNFNLGFTLAKNATVNSQSNYFENGYDMSSKLSTSGALNDYGNAKGFHDSGSNVSFAQKSQTTSWQPDEYRRNVTSAEQAKQYDLIHAGAGKG